MSSAPRIVRSVALITALLGGSAGVSAWLFSLRTKPPQHKTAPLPPMVDSMVVRSDDVTEWFVGYGTAKAGRRAKVSAEVAATVIERVGMIEDGSAVSEGQLLLRLDDREFQLLLKQAEALTVADQAAIEENEAEARTLQELIATAEGELRVAVNERTRLADLFERALAARKEYDFAKLACEQARRVLQGYEMERSKNAPRRRRLVAAKQGHEASAVLARLNIKRCKIVAPFSGVIETLFVDRGDRAAPGMVLLTLVDASHVEVPIQLAASLQARVRIGTACRLHSESMPDREWHGTVARIALSVDENTRTFAAYVDVDNTEQPQHLAPGTFVTAVVRGPTYEDRLTVPRQAVHEGYVFVARSGVARRCAVRVERLVADRAIVTGNLRGGDQVILSHLSKLEDGSAIRAMQRPSSSDSRRVERLTGDGGGRAAGAAESSP